MNTDTPALDEAAQAYLDLIKRCVTRSAFPEVYQPLHPGRRWRYRLYEPVRRLLARRGLELVRNLPRDTRAMVEGQDWPAQAETMVGLRRLENVESCVVRAVTEGVPGDLAEAGVWRGGTSIFMRAILRALGETERRVWVADSFQGLPKPNAKRWPADAEDTHWKLDHLAISKEEVEANFARYGLLDDQVRFLPGWFEDTLASASIDSLAVLRVDGDMYGSTMETLEALYPKLSPGGYVIVDDYGAIDQCRQATDDYRAEHGIKTPIEWADWTGVWWRKEAGPS